ncbi:U1 small nuclear ribonucleoprotein C [Mercurialis annua]|uniref:U1 small nuclear ribonucleoprotein C n=1 Tax=Mercurialis annua TaxID=3986 RepID=UPI00215F443A|nr:U1 small nuclear ribonucleoprotein C [Mercurialis annua]
MPRYYCDYCDTYLTHDSPSVRKQHNAGYKHKANVRNYYQQFEEQQTQSLIDQRIKEHLGAAFQQVGAAYNQHLLARPRLPVLPTPMMPMAGNPQMMAGFRPPLVLPRPPGPPGYFSAPGMPPMMAPPGTPSLPGQLNGLPRPPMMMPPSSAPGSTTALPPSSGAPSMAPNYQPNPTPPSSGGYDSFNNNQAPESNH